MTEPRPDALSDWQIRAMSVPESYDLALCGGRGSGKTRSLASLFLRHCEQHGDKARCLIIRKSFPGLQDVESELLSYFQTVYGSALRYDSNRHRFTLPTGGTISLNQLERESDFQKFQGASYTYIAVDEAAQYASPVLVDRLRSSLRGPAGVPLRFIVLANPGGVGHHWMARRHALNASWLPYTEEATGAQFVTINATYRDNPFIDRDKYQKNLLAACATDPELAKAWLDGDWTVLRGAYFANVIDNHRNMIEPWTTLPNNNSLPPAGTPGYRYISSHADQWSIFISHDFGVSAPSVTYLLAVSPGAEHEGYFYPRGSVILVDEDAVVHPDDDTSGLGLTVPDQASRIVSMCAHWGISPNGAADDAIFNRTGSQAGSIADEFKKQGVHFAKARKGSRIAGWQIMRRLLSDAGKPDKPGLYVSRRCRYWWTTVPALPRDPRNSEDVDSSAPDHAADACRYGLTYSPLFFGLTGIRSAT